MSARRQRRSKPRRPASREGAARRHARRRQAAPRSEPRRSRRRPQCRPQPQPPAAAFSRRRSAARARPDRPRRSPAVRASRRRSPPTGASAGLPAAARFASRRLRATAFCRLTGMPRHDLRRDLARLPLIHSRPLTSHAIIASALRVRDDGQNARYWGVSSDRGARRTRTHDGVRGNRARPDQGAAADRRRRAITKSGTSTRPAIIPRSTRYQRDAGAQRHADRSRSRADLRDLSFADRHRPHRRGRRPRDGRDRPGDGPDHRRAGMSAQLRPRASPT